MWLIVVAPLGRRLHEAGRMFQLKPACLLCTDPNQPTGPVLRACLCRRGIEVSFRGHTGSGG